jgi:hypothetical protein
MNTIDPGYHLTKRFADAAGKPFLVNPTPQQLANWIQTNGIETLNIAGNV